MKYLKWILLIGGGLLLCSAAAAGYGAFEDGFNAGFVALSLIYFIVAIIGIGVGSIID